MFCKWKFDDFLSYISSFSLFLLLTKYFCLILAIFLVCYWQSRVGGTTLFFRWLMEPWRLLLTMAVVLLQPSSNLKPNSNFAMGTGTKFMVNTKLLGLVMSPSRASSSWRIFSSARLELENSSSNSFLLTSWKTRNYVALAFWQTVVQKYKHAQFRSSWL